MSGDAATPRGRRGDGCDRSRHWLEHDDLFGFMHRATLRAAGLTSDAVRGRPVVGICSAWSELVTCNLHLRGLAEAVKRGVWRSGGLPLEFPSMSLSEYFMKPTTMLYRNLAAMEVEETIRSSPFDAVVLLAGCDKTVPAQLMGATGANVPAIMLTAGPRNPGRHRGERMSAGTDLWERTADLRAGRMSAAEYAELEAAAAPSVGTCSEMGTASTMAAVVETLGLSLPGAAPIPAGDARRVQFAEATGARAVGLAREGLRPRDLLDADSFDNALTALAALAGSTNAVLHLLALARRAGVELSLERFDEVAARTPVLANVQPVGEHLFEDLFHAGGVGALLSELRPLLRTEARTVTGRTLGAEIADASVRDRDLIRTLDAPLAPAGGLVVLRGSLAPGGAVLKASAMAPALRRHSGRALVFDGIADLMARIDDPDLPADETSVLVLRGAGPKGAPGMPEWGMIPIPRKLLERGVRDMLRISDARMSGTGYGAVVVHVAPESAVGGPLHAVRDGDEIALDVDARRLDLVVPDAEVARRLAADPPPARTGLRGHAALHDRHVLQADAGADLDLFDGPPPDRDDTLPGGLLRGWLTGW